MANRRCRIRWTQRGDGSINLLSYDEGKTKSFAPKWMTHPSRPKRAELSEYIGTICSKHGCSRLASPDEGGWAWGWKWEMSWINLRLLDVAVESHISLAPIVIHPRWFASGLFICFPNINIDLRRPLLGRRCKKIHLQKSTKLKQRLKHPSNNFRPNGYRNFTFPLDLDSFMGSDFAIPSL